MTVDIYLTGFTMHIGPSAQFKGPDGFRIVPENGVEERNWLGHVGASWIVVPERRKVVASFSCLGTFATLELRNAFILKVATHSDPETMVNGGDGLWSFASANVVIEIVSIMGLSVRCVVRMSSGNYGGLLS